MKKVCKSCKLFVEGNECPLCKSNQLSTNWQGRLIILDANKSMIAQNMKINMKGEYAIKVR
ncbi:DNA-directed RNA polymerase subunit E'' [Candidatus Woesearchaeota archaeon]|nr:DNA-directed RNA polymerase subunit E'' [Candidatus Woesearchaeota archaeon]